MDDDRTQGQGGNGQGGFQSRMVDVSSLNLTCASCGVAITELPFNPTKREDGTYGKLYCRDCNSKRPRRNTGFGGGRSFGGGDRGGYQRNNRF